MAARGQDGECDFIDRHDILALIRHEFLKVDPAFDVKKALRRRRLAALNARLTPEVRAQLQISSQIADEVHWLLNYGADWPRIDRRLDDLAASLEVKDQTITGQDDLGSWGPGFTEPFMLLEPTVDALQSKGLETKRLKPLTFLQDFQDDRVLLSYLHSLQISDIDQALHNHRDELGAVLAALSQLFFKCELRKLLKDHKDKLGFEITPRLEQAYRDFVDQSQHPRTGYWGPWYRFGSELYQVQDLSYTFHHVSYLKGQVNHWRSIIDTTLAIKDLIYPTGWSHKIKGQYDNHDLYDVATIASLGWRHATRAQRGKLAKDIADVLGWSLGNTLTVMGEGQAASVDIVGDPKPTLDDYYFGVRFFDRVGLWDEAKRFWTGEPIPLPANLPEPRRIAQSLLENFRKLPGQSELADEVRAILCPASKGQPTPGDPCQEHP